ncbi:MAG: hypothetical protein DVB23_000562 [Verrucomicrobia bacterium]|nr:MAG: hypothetical protein DVB23_000562 [Verrucomicrobiota bacterium]
MKLARALVVLTLVLQAASLQAGEEVVVPVSPRPNPLAPIGRAIGNVVIGIGEWIGSIFIGSAEELGLTAVGAVNATDTFVTEKVPKVFEGAARYANDTKSDND